MAKFGMQLLTAWTCIYGEGMADTSMPVWTHC